MQVHRNDPARGPIARFENLVVTETADEVLLYDTEKHHIHHLNATTAAVWRHADGQHSVTELAREAGGELGAQVDEATVRLALTRLDDAGLLQESLADELRMSRISRRTFMQRAGVAGAIAVPAIVSTTAAVSAQSPDVCGEVCGAFLNVLTGEFSIVDPCAEEGSDCQQCPGELTAGDPCGGFGWVCYLGSCAGETQAFAIASVSSGIPTEEELLAYGEEVYAEELATQADEADEAQGTDDGENAVFLEPAISGVPETGSPGETISATVSGFADGETVTVSFAGTPVEDTTNGGSVSITLPIVDVDTTFEVGAYGNSSEAYAAASVAVTAPVIDQNTSGDTTEQNTGGDTTNLNEGNGGTGESNLVEGTGEGGAEGGDTGTEEMGGDDAPASEESGEEGEV